MWLKLEDMLKILLRSFIRGWNLIYFYCTTLPKLVRSSYIKNVLYDMKTVRSSVIR